MVLFCHTTDSFLQLNNVPTTTTWQHCMIEAMCIIIASKSIWLQSYQYCHCFTCIILNVKTTCTFYFQITNTNCIIIIEISYLKFYDCIRPISCGVHLSVQLKLPTCSFLDLSSYQKLHQSSCIAGPLLKSKLSNKDYCMNGILIHFSLYSSYYV